MLKPPSQNVPGMTDTLEFVKTLWGGMGVPGMPAAATPALSLDELDKRITDLKAVESWLNLNLTMLRTSIHALEVQRGTIAALKSMSDNMAQAMGQKPDQTAALAPFAAFFSAAGAQQAGTPPAGAGATADAAMPAAVAWWNLLQDQFQQAVASAIPADSAQRDKAGAKPADGAAAVSDPAERAGTGGDAGGTPGTSSQKPSRTKSDKA
ncbi:PhaM family polyhydroxyalkanoate granule multifunctional regulatory protein [Massilia jejuensis]|uniref:PhaM family polyhydroxyalkanoate granule multifunctional regulatory protein n=1 Tax=Massilia jejuensis TaxID=648894 RepID=A0ABW0PLC2_9BURK